MIPFADPQFWLVTAAAAGAVIYLLRKRLRIRRKGEIELPCENCPQNRAHTAASRRATSPKRG